MKSKSALTNEIEYMKLAANELAQVLDGFTLEKNSLGILYCAVESDVAELLKELKPKLPFEIVGTMTQAVLDNKTGTSEFATSLTVLTSDDCNFNVFVSEPVTPETIKNNIKNMCEAANNTTAKDAKLILCHTPLINKIILDEYPDHFHEFTGGKPVFGGVSGTEVINGFSAAIHNDNVYTDRIVAVFIDGNIRPVFSIGSNISSSVEKKRTVTSSKDGVIYTIDDMNFVNYLNSVGVVTELRDKAEMDLMLSSIALSIEFDDERGGDGVGVYRTVYSINYEDGSGFISGRVPQGSKISTVAYKKGYVNLSTYDCISVLIDRINKAETLDYTYSTVLCGSCNGRYMFMFPTNSIEGDVIVQYVPKELNLAGYYTNGEICPTSVNGDVAVNRCHNATLTMCAF